MGKRIKVDTSKGQRRIVTPPSPMRRVSQETVAAALGAEKAIELPHGGSPITLHGLRIALQEALRSTGGRPGLEGITRRPKIPLRADVWERLAKLAERLAKAGTSASPGQIASILIEQGLDAVDEAQPGPLAGSGR